MTTSDKHQKHPKLSRPTQGHYHRCEWAIYGTGCSNIEAFFRTIEEALIPDFRCAYVDGDHSKSIRGKRLQVGEKVFVQGKAHSWNEKDDCLAPIESDVVFVNGNHFPAARQIVFMDDKKRDSLERRKEQLDSIHILIKESADQEVYDFLKPKIHAGTQVFNKAEMPQILELLRSEVAKRIPPLKALILAGGKSTRMGTDKSQVRFDGALTQEVRMAQLCASMGLETFISKAQDFQEDRIEDFTVIKDRLLDMGPFGAIVSAMMHDPDAAWLVLACDLPFIDESVLKGLIAQRYHSGIATAYKASERPFPEPLITIYEPRAYPRFLSFLSQGHSCPRKVIINSDVKVLDLEDELLIRNVNTPEDLEDALSQNRSHSGSPEI